MATFLPLSSSTCHLIPRLLMVLSTLLLWPQAHGNISARESHLGPESTVIIEDRIDSGFLEADLKIHLSATRAAEIFPEATSHLLCFQDLGPFSQQEQFCLHSKVFSDGSQLRSYEGYHIAQVMLYEVDVTNPVCKTPELLKKILEVRTLICQESSLSQQRAWGISNLTTHGKYASYQLQNELERRRIALERVQEQLVRRPGGDNPF